MKTNWKSILCLVFMVTASCLTAFCGKWVEEEVPDTLDLTELAERAWDPLIAWAEDTKLYPQGSASPLAPNRGVLGPKYMEALAMIRAMTGLQKDKEREQLVRFLAQDEMWQAFEVPEELAGANPARYSGHLHAKTIALRGILDYAEVTSDTNLMDFVKNGYEWTKQFGIPEIGWIPEWTNNNFCEGCQISDMVALAIHLSDLGVGDYWEDVDRYIRNQMVESQQKCDIPTVNGKWAAAALVNMMLDHDGSSCCTPNCALAVYYAWESILRFDEGTAQINLLLNRTSPWMDVYSYLPYEGKVVLKNKTAKNASVRIPMWVNRKKIKCAVNGRNVEPIWVGNYLFFDNLKKNSVIAVEFPMEERTIVTPPLEGTSDGGAGPAHGVPYTIHFKGNTVLDIQPRFDAWNKGKGPENVVQTYRRDYFEADKAPMIRKKLYVADKTIPWKPSQDKEISHA